MWYSLEYCDLRALLTQTKLKPKEITTMKITYQAFENEKGILRVADKREWNASWRKTADYPEKTAASSLRAELT